VNIIAATWSECKTVLYLFPYSIALRSLLLSPSVPRQLLKQIKLKHYRFISSFDTLETAATVKKQIKPNFISISISNNVNNENIVFIIYFMADDIMFIC